MVKTALRTLQTALVPRSGGAVDSGRWAADNGVDCLTCEAAVSVGLNGAVNVANSVGTLVGPHCGRDRGRRDAKKIVGRLTSGRGPIGVRASVGTSVGQSCGRKRRQDSGNSVGRSTSGCGSISIGASVGLTAFAKELREMCRDLGWLELQTQTASGCWRPRGTVVIETWVNWRRGVVLAGDSVGRSASGRWSGDGEYWLSTASSRWSGFVGNSLG